MLINFYSYLDWPWINIKKEKMASFNLKFRFQGADCWMLKNKNGSASWNYRFSDLWGVFLQPFCFIKENIPQIPYS